MIWQIRQNTLSFDRTVLMGILNVTPDSFSDGGCYLDGEKAFERALQMIEEGADILDLGAESTRPGAKSVSAEEELGRLLPLVTRLRQKVNLPISIDTTKVEVARQCLEAGADIINDVSGLRRSGSEMAKIARQFGSGMVLMHSRGTPETMQGLAEYRDVVTEVVRELRESVCFATEAGVKPEQIVIDPGLGFAKTAGQSFEILKHLRVFHEIGLPLMIGPSRKSFVGQVTGRNPKEREFGTAACVAVAVMRGVQILRVHEVGAMRDVIRMTETIKGDE
ncbi:MAG TPA: dihydropteroate synthase [Candidatus Omnitrophota bacterium]|nr:dihydropteroate synthase [Candidatus Omnitrophota bacterium]